MKKTLVGILLMTCILSCGRPTVTSSLVKGSPLYQFATDLAAKWPIFNPEKNSTLAECKYFTIRVDSFLIEMHAVAGKSMFEMPTWPVEQLRQTVSINVERMAERRLLGLAARRQGVHVPAAEIDSAMQRLYRQNGGEKGFMEKLKKDDLSVELIRKSIDEEMTMRRFLKEMASQDPVVTEEEIQALYQQEKTATFQHILLVHAGVADSVYNVRQKKLMNGIAAGRDFSSLAKEFSDDPHSRTNGGLYQEIPRGYWPKKLDDLIFSAPLQQVQETTTDQGKHVIKVLSRDKEKRPLDQVRLALQEQVRQSKRKSQRQDYLQQLKNEAQLRPTF
jgi:parvulin-like peptidyl-prolyl isomerase